MFITIQPLFNHSFMFDAMRLVFGIKCICFCFCFNAINIFNCDYVTFMNSVTLDGHIHILCTVCVPREPINFKVMMLTDLYVRRQHTNISFKLYKIVAV